MVESFIEAADAKILCCFAKLLTEVSSFDDDQLNAIFGTFGTLLSSHKSQIKFSSLSNITAVIVYYSSALSLTLQDVVVLARGLYDNVKGESIQRENEEESNDIEEFAQYIANYCDGDQWQLNHHQLTKMAQEILEDIQLKEPETILGAGFDESSVWPYLFGVIQKRLFVNSLYIDNIDIQPPLVVMINGSGFDPLSGWYTRFYKPFRYYWDNYACIATADAPLIRYHEYCKSSSTAPGSIFEALIEPINGGNAYSDKVEPVVWLENVILPVVRWQGYQLQPLNDWMFKQTGSSSKKQELWQGVWDSLVKAETPYESLKDIISNFVAACYYDTIYESAQMTSLEMSRTLDLIKENCVLLIPIVPGDPTEVPVDVKFDSEASYDSYEQFKRSTSLQPLLTPTKQNLIFLSEMTDTCSKLFPINQLDVPLFLQLKYSPSNIEESKREVSKIISGLKSTNSSQFLSLLDLFKSTFIANESEREAIDTLVLDRFLFNNLFDIVNSFCDEDKLGVPGEVLYHLLTKKFWDSVNNATNFDDRVGKLSQAASCIALFDKLASSKKITEDQRAEVSKLKHLMKIFANIKNFKLYTSRTTVLVPPEVIKKYGSLPSNEELRTEMEATSPMGLITTILEQNPKSYLAFEKLFKVLNDFLIYLDDTQSNAGYYLQRLSSACIEASLIDNNFAYAYKKSVDLLDQYGHSKGGSNLNNMWMTFYQVGNYHSPDWSTDSHTLESSRVEVLHKQSEILARYLKVIDRSDVSVDNSRIIVQQWERVNKAIDSWYGQVESVQKENHRKLSTGQLQQDITNTANEILNDAANTTSQASEKLSNLFVSGLGWAIGAKTSR